MTGPVIDRVVAAATEIATSIAKIASLKVAGNFSRISCVTGLRS